MHSDFFKNKMNEINNEFDIGVTLDFDTEKNNSNVIDESTSLKMTHKKRLLMRFAKILRKCIKDDESNKIVVTDDGVMLKII